MARNAGKCPQGRRQNAERLGGAVLERGRSQDRPPRCRREVIRPAAGRVPADGAPGRRPPGEDVGARPPQRGVGPRGQLRARAARFRWARASCRGGRAQADGAAHDRTLRSRGRGQRAGAETAAQRCPLRPGLPERPGALGGAASGTRIRPWPSSPPWDGPPTSTPRCGSDARSGPWCWHGCRGPTPARGQGSGPGGAGPGRRQRGGDGDGGRRDAVPGRVPGRRGALAGRRRNPTRRSWRRSTSDGPSWPHPWGVRVWRTSWDEAWSWRTRQGLADAIADLLLDPRARRHSAWRDTTRSRLSTRGTAPWRRCSRRSNHAEAFRCSDPARRCGGRRRSLRPLGAGGQGAPGAARALGPAGRGGHASMPTRTRCRAASSTPDRARRSCGCPRSTSRSHWSPASSRGASRRGSAFLPVSGWPSRAWMVVGAVEGVSVPQPADPGPLRGQGHPLHRRGVRAGGRSACSAVYRQRRTVATWESHSGVHHCRRSHDDRAYQLQYTYTRAPAAELWRSRLGDGGHRSCASSPCVSSCGWRPGQSARGTYWLWCPSSPVSCWPISAPCW